MELHGNVAEDIWGPKCNECMINSGDPMQFVRLNLAERKFMQTYYGNIRRICRYCLHNIIYNSHMAWWKFTSRGHVILDNPKFASRITSYLWRTVCWQNCRCGDCESSWFIRGWRCWGQSARWEHWASMADPFRATCVRWYCWWILMMISLFRTCMTTLLKASVMARVGGNPEILHSFPTQPCLTLPQMSWTINFYFSATAIWMCSLVV